MTAARSSSPRPPLARMRLAGLALATLAAVLLALSLAMPSWSKANSKVVGIASAIVREVSIKPASLTRYARAKLRQRISLADQVRTGPNSRLQIALLDNTKISLGGNAQLTIDKFIYDPNGGSVSVGAAKGALRFISGSTRAKRSVRTPSATIGIRGTIFDTAIGALAVEIAQRERAIPQDTRHDPLTATLAVLRGPGPNSQGRATPGAIDVNAAGRTVALEQPLLAAYVPYAGAAPIGPFPISLTGLNRLNDFILPPPPKREFQQASEGHPVPYRERVEPPPRGVGGLIPPRGGAGPGAGPGPGAGFGVPGGFGQGFPTFPGGAGVGTTPPTNRRPPVGTTTPPTGRPPAGTTTTPPTQVPQNPPVGAAPGNTPQQPTTNNGQQPTQIR